MSLPPLKVPFCCPPGEKKRCQEPNSPPSERWTGWGVGATNVSGGWRRDFPRTRSWENAENCFREQIRTTKHLCRYSRRPSNEGRRPVAVAPGAQSLATVRQTACGWQVVAFGGLLYLDEARARHRATDRSGIIGGAPECSGAISVRRRVLVAMDCQTRGTRKHAPSTGPPKSKAKWLLAGRNGS